MKRIFRLSLSFAFALMLHFSSINLHGQDSLRLLRHIPVPAGCSALEADSEGNLYLLEDAANRIHKVLAVNNYDSTLSIGGRGMRSEGFIHLTGIRVRNRQKLYALDDAQRRISVLNTNLRVVDEVSFIALSPQAARFTQGADLFPLCFDLSPAGELFVLNQDARVYKTDVFGQLETVFGGADYGAGALYRPDDIQLTDANAVWVSDTSAQELKLYDFFGIYRRTLRPAPGFRWRMFTPLGDHVALANDRQLVIVNLQSGALKHIVLPPGPALTAIAGGQGVLYLLRGDAVQVCGW